MRGYVCSQRAARTLALTIVWLLCACSSSEGDSATLNPQPEIPALPGAGSLLAAGGATASSTASTQAGHQAASPQPSGSAVPSNSDK